MLNRNTAAIISEFLGNDDTTRKNLLLVNKSYYCFFNNTLLLQHKVIAYAAHHRQEEVDHILCANPELVADKKFMQALLFHHVMFGQLKAAEAILKVNPDLLFLNGTARDYSLRTFTGSNPIRYCLWAGDSIMLAMLLYYLIPLEKGLAYAKTQFAEHETQGVTYLIERKDQPSIKIENEKQFDFNLLINALEHYKTNLPRWNHEECQSYWHEKVVPLQEDIVAHWAQHYCEPNETFSYTSTFERRFARSFKVYDHVNEKEGIWFPLVNSSIRQSEVAVFRTIHIMPNPTPQLSSFRQLWEVRKKDLISLKNYIDDPSRNPLPHYLDHKLSILKKGWSCPII